MNSLLSRAGHQLEKGFPFVLFRKPDETEITGIFQKDAETHLIKSFEESGYAFVPFFKGKALLIPAEASEIMTAPWQKGPHFENTGPPLVSETAHDRHKVLVQKGIDAIKDGQFQKVVLSRKQKASHQSVSFVPVFENMLNTYPEAYAYCFFHPESGLWMGAFSERLVRFDGSRVFTMALAGTRTAATSDLAWGDKERQEQQFVTDAVTEALRQSCDHVEVGEAITVDAGKLQHLRSIITAELTPGSSKKQLIEALHPTPAVCGLPKAAARNFIIKEEGYDREYYAGFHGLLNVGSATDLFVNLRCMKWEGGAASLYIGGGITEASDPESEWMETVKKAGTMNTILI